MSAYCKQSLAGALLIVGLLTGCESDAPQQGDRPPGEAAFVRHCASCHGSEGQGRGPTFPPLAGSEWIELPPEALTAIVLLGLRGEVDVGGQRYSGYMPPLGHIDDERLAAIIRYSQSQWADAVSDWTADDVAALRARLADRRPLEGRQAVNQLLEDLP